MIARLRTESADTATALRRGVLALALLGILGTTAELVFLRHWGSATRNLVWPPVALLVIAFAAVARRPGPRAIGAVRAIAVVVAAWALVGVGLHIIENMDAGPLDRAFATRWDSMPLVEQLFDAVTGAVGPAPTLAPGALAEIALALLVATFRHPALRRAGEPGRER